MTRRPPGDPSGLPEEEPLSGDEHRSLWEALAEAPEIAPPTLRSERFDIVRRLGAGGMGVVHEAVDRSSGARVALKTLRRLDPDGLLRFKEEFRLLQGISHRNLVRLGELLEERGTWLFTMELVDGEGFHDHVRASPGSQAPFDQARLRDAFRQLAIGLHALHTAGRVHRDVKPSNVMVDRDGRVVILDFGLARDLWAGREGAAPAASGTPGYVAPEQLAGAPPSPAGDWFAVGVMLHEALTGRLPWRPGRSGSRVVERSRDLRPIGDAPADLVELCEQLLAPDPAERPSAEQILERLDAPVGPSLAAPHHLPAGFVGRAEELALFERLHGVVRSGGTAVVVVGGVSGIGKSALVAEALARVAPSGATVLSGRCYERESVPYKALDSLVDALARHWEKLPDDEARSLVPPRIGALARMFPVLAKVRAVRRAVGHAPDATPPSERRQHAAAALEEVLRGLAARGPTVLHIDDLQWGDTDSTALLAELLRPPAVPGLWLVLATRDAPGTRALREQAASEVSWAEVTLEPLPHAEAAELAKRLLPDMDDPGTVDGIARDSGGSPFFIGELVRHRGHAGADELTLEQLLHASLRRLPDEARRLLRAVSVAARPVAQRLAAEAAEVPDLRSTMDLLRADNLVRTRGLHDDDAVEAFHDRIRETVVAGLEPAALMAIHRSLARTLERSGDADPEVLAEHWGGGGEPDRARGFAIVAAERAAEAMAFERAARLYRQVLEGTPDGTPGRHDLTVSLAEALANAGRGPEAAERFLEAVATAPDDQELALRRRAAEELLRCGRVDEGLEVMEAVLARVGLRLAKTPTGAMLSLVAGRVRLSLRGLRFRERPEADVPADVLARVDATWAVATGLTKVDMVRGTDFVTRGLILSLGSGEPYRVARSLALEASQVAFEGQKAAPRVAQLVSLSHELAGRIDSPHATGLAHMAAGVSALVLGRWREAGEQCTEAERILREQCTGVSWEINISWGFAATALEYMGEWRELCPRAVDDYRAAMDRGDLHAAIDMIVYVAFHHLGLDDPDTAMRTIEETMAGFSHRGMLLQHYLALLGATNVDLYRGDAQSAWRRLDEQWRALSRSLIFRASLLRAEAIDLRGRAALALAAEREGSERKELLSVATWAIRRLGRERMAWCDALAQMLRAELARVSGDGDRAVEELGRAAEAFSAVEMGLHAAAARDRLGRMLGGDEGVGMVRAADAWIQAQNARAPDRVSRMLAGGG